jgi:phosphopantetheinyl transferase
MIFKLLIFYGYKDIHKFVFLNYLLVFEIRHINDTITLGLLNLDEFAKQYGFVHKRAYEKAGTHFLIEKMLNHTNYKLLYSAEGKPYLEESKVGISISHSHGKLALLINKGGEAGIDIELIRDKVKAIQHKFLNDTEKLMADNNPEKLITMWAAKEALYKVYGLKGVDFKEHLFVDELTETEMVGRIEIRGYKKRYKLITEKIEDYKLVYVLHEI